MHRFLHRIAQSANRHAKRDCGQHEGRQHAQAPGPLRLQPVPCRQRLDRRLGFGQALRRAGPGKSFLLREQVWETLQKTVADILGVNVEDITPSARFVEDLGAG